jgi:putative endopeptidase
MTEATKAEALAKLDSFDPRSAILQVRDLRRARHHSRPAARQPHGADPPGGADAFAKLGKPVDRTEWGMLPQTVNAYYMLAVQPDRVPRRDPAAAVLQRRGDPAVNYGAIGGGDRARDRPRLRRFRARKSDGTGTLRNWWQPEDMAGFRERTSRLVGLLQQYCIDDGQVCLTSRGLGETLGDVVGLQMAWQAYRLSLGGQEPPVIDGLTGDQRFFLGFAQVWRGKYREQALRAQMIGGSPHPPNDFRLNNAVRHIDAWYEAFNVTPEDPLYLPPEERVRIW